MTQVSINLYDLSQGMAKSMSQMLIGRQIEGIWHTGVIVLFVVSPLYKLILPHFTFSFNFLIMNI